MLRQLKAERFQIILGSRFQVLPPRPLCLSVVVYPDDLGLNNCGRDGKSPVTPFFVDRCSLFVEPSTTSPTSL